MVFAVGRGRSDPHQSTISDPEALLQVCTLSSRQDGVWAQDASMRRFPDHSEKEAKDGTVDEGPIFGGFGGKRGPHRSHKSTISGPEALLHNLK